MQPGEEGIRDRVTLKQQISEEMADILIYLCMGANSMGVDLEKEYYRKQEKNALRFREGRGGAESRMES